jgi:general secretion pathway protein G
MKKGFTMIELIFVIVILGILAAVAIPRLAATRNDAKAASIKTDIGTAMQAIPAWFQGQKEVAFQNAMSIDTNVWKQQNQTGTGTGSACYYKYTDDAGDYITMKVTQDANVTALAACPESNASVYGLAPTLRVDLNNSNGGSIVDTLKTNMGVQNLTIKLGGTKVKF